MLLSLGLSTPALANPLAASTAEILIRLSLQTTTHALAEGSAATTEETSEGTTNATKATSKGSSSSSSDDRKYSADTRLHPQVGAALLREAYNLDGPNLKIIADGLGVTEKQLAQAIMAAAPLRPTEEDLVRLLAYAVPELQKKGHIPQV